MIKTELPLDIPPPSKKKAENLAWQSLKQPITVILFCLGAALLLWSLSTKKKAYDAEQNMLIVVVDSREDNPSNKAIIANALIESLGNEISSKSTNETQQKQKKSGLEKIITQSVNAIKFHEFKSGDEFSMALIEQLELLRLKEARMHELKIDEYSLALNIAREKAGRAVEKIDRLKENNGIDANRSINDLITILDSEIDDDKLNEDAKNAREFLKYLQKDKKFDLKTIRSNWSEFTDNTFEIATLNSSISKQQKSIETIDQDFGPVIRMAYQLRGKELSKLFHLEGKTNYSDRNSASNDNRGDADGKADQSVASTEAPSVNTNNADKANVIASAKAIPDKKSDITLWKDFLDDSGPLNVVYKLAELLLAITFVFGLIYLILIPIRNVFFLNSHSDLISEQGKKYLEGRSASASIVSPVATAAAPLLVTVGAIFVGVAVVINAPLPSFPAADGSEVPSIAKSLSGRKSGDDNRRPTATPTPGPVDIGGSVGNSKIDTAALERRLETLEGSINTLNDNVKAINMGSIGGTLGNIERASVAINQTLGNAESEGPDTIVGQLKGTKKEIDAVRTDLGFRPPYTASANSTQSSSATTGETTFFLVTPDEELIANSLVDPPIPPTARKPQNMREWFMSVDEHIDRLAKVVGVEDYEAQEKSNPKNAFLEIQDINAKIGSPRSLMMLTGTSTTGSPQVTTSTTSPSPSPVPSASPSPTPTPASSTRITYHVEETLAYHIGALITDVFEVKQSIGSENYNKNNSTVFDALGMKNDDAKQKTMVGIVKAISANTNDLGHFLVSESGSSSTLIKRLLEGRQYRITPFLIAQLRNEMRPEIDANYLNDLKTKAEKNDKEAKEKLEKAADDEKSRPVHNAELTLIIDALEQFTVKGENAQRTISEKQLLKAINSDQIDVKRLKRWMEMIFDYSYVYN